MTYHSFEKNLLYRLSKGDAPVIVFQEEDNDNYLDIYEQLQYIPHFLYAMIHHRVKIELFIEVIEYIYDNYNDISFLFDYFFKPTYPITSNDFLFNKMKNQDIIKQIPYLFLSFEPYNHDIILNKENLPYLMKMIELIPEKKRTDLWDGNYSSFLNIFSHNFHLIEPLLHLTMHYNQPFMVNYFFRKIHSCYQEKEKKNIVSSLLTVLPYLPDVVLENIWNKDYQIHSFIKQSNHNMLDFYLYLVESSCFVSNINNKTNELKHTLSEQEFLLFFKEFPPVFSERIKRISELNLDFNELDITLSGSDNLIFIIAIDHYIKNGNEDVPPHIIQYCHQFYQTCKTTFPLYYSCPLFSTEFITYIMERNSIIEFQQQLSTQLPFQNTKSKHKI